MKKFGLVILVFIVSISFTGCTMTPKEQAAYNLKEQKRAQCKMRFRNCIVNNSQGRNMSNIHVSMQVSNYCLQAVPCYR